MSWQQKFTKRRLLGRTFVKKKRNWMDFGIPGEAIGRALGRILGKKNWSKKKGKKKWPSRLVKRTLGGTRGPRQGRFGRTNKPGLTRPWPTLSGWAGGLFALRVTRRGHLEAENFEALKLWGLEASRLFFRCKKSDSRFRPSRKCSKIGNHMT